jgi:ATP-dependent DNA helicase RecG
MHPRDNILPAKESKQVEFKTSFNDEAIVSLVAFANTQGGAVYIGVTDSGEVKGIQLGKETLADWINEVKNKKKKKILIISSTSKITKNFIRLIMMI